MERRAARWFEHGREFFTLLVEKLSNGRHSPQHTNMIGAGV
jgi:hypothetical protein